MTDLEISKALALAIGWKPEQMRLPLAWRDGVRMEVAADWGDYWRPFDYRDWNVIGPIAEKYDCFPALSGQRSKKGQWFSPVGEVYNGAYADTPQTAIALAVIQGANK
jgi:hypothetical protein